MFDYCLTYIHIIIIYYSTILVALHIINMSGISDVYSEWIMIIAISCFGYTWQVMSKFSDPKLDPLPIDPPLIRFRLERDLLLQGETAAFLGGEER